MFKNINFKVKVQFLRNMCLKTNAIMLYKEFMKLKTKTVQDREIATKQIVGGIKTISQLWLNISNTQKE